MSWRIRQLASMNIEVKIAKLYPETEKLKAIANITLDGSFAVHGIRVFDSEKGFFVSMPSTKLGEKRKDVFHPVNSESRAVLVDAILAEYEKAKSEAPETEVKQ